MLARMYAMLDMRQISDAGVAHLASVWEARSDRLSCGGVCWETNHARLSFDAAFCSATGVPPRVVATAKAEITAFLPMIAFMRGDDPEELEHCHAPGNCPGEYLSESGVPRRALW